MKHNYNIALTEQASSEAAGTIGTPLEMTFQSHDDLAEIVAKVTAKGLFGENETKIFAVGLKMFASVMLAHRDEPPFVELAPHFGAFMKKLKS